MVRNERDATAGALRPIEREEVMTRLSCRSVGHFARHGFRFAGLALTMVFCLPRLGAGAPAPPSKGKPPANLSVTTEILDYDSGNLVSSISSDGQGVYLDGVNGVSSILTANVCNGLTWGDWRFDASASNRSVTESFFTPDDAIQPGDPHYQAPANPPYVGSQL